MQAPQPLLKDNFKSLSWDKVQFLRLLANDTELAKCLLCKSESFKEYEPTVEEKDKLIWQNIFPFPYTVDISQEVNSYITMGFKYNKSESSKIWKVGNITIYCFCHKDIVKTGYGVLRYDYMLQRVNDLIFNSKSSNWIGPMEFVEMDDVVMDGGGNYVGVKVVYRNTELM